MIDINLTDDELNSLEYFSTDKSIRKELEANIKKTKEWKDSYLYMPLTRAEIALVSESLQMYPSILLDERSSLYEALMQKFGHLAKDLGESDPDVWEIIKEKISSSSMKGEY